MNNRKQAVNKIKPKESIVLKQEKAVTDDEWMKERMNKWTILTIFFSISSFLIFSFLKLSCVILESFNVTVSSMLLSRAQKYHDSLFVCRKQSLRTTTQTYSQLQMNYDRNIIDLPFSVFVFK